MIQQISRSGHQVRETVDFLHYYATEAERHDALVTGDPWSLDTDIAPVIDEDARAEIATYVVGHEKEGRVLKRLEAPETGTFVGATIVEVGGIQDLEREVFGPVLNIATFEANEIDETVDAINAKGFGLNTRIDDRVQQIVDRIHVGNTYVNRNQIVVIVGSQPFGGEGLSGTGPKAGGPNYVARSHRTKPLSDHTAPEIEAIPAAHVTEVLAALDGTG